MNNPTFLQGKGVYFAGAILASLVLVVGLWSYTRATGDAITACINKSGGIRILLGNNTACHNNETLLSWNIMGLQGPKGDNGDTGPQGEQGVPGVSAETLPNVLAPSFTSLKFCKKNDAVSFSWELSNSYGLLADVGGTSWGTLTNGVWSKNTNGSQNSISFVLTSDELLTAATGTPISFSGNIWWHGFIVPIAGFAISMEVPACQNL